MRNVLLVTRNFAPTSHVSAERATKLAKYLPEFGWQPTILTGARPTAGLPEDRRLLEQLPGIEIIRARAPEFSLFYRSPAKNRHGGPALRAAPKRGAWHPKAWLVPDSQALWYPFAVRAALRRAPERRWDAVIATSFPPTAILIAHTLAARLHVPYVADFRDAWTQYAGAPRRPAPLAALERRLETRVLADAAAVVTVDPQMVASALARVREGDRPPLYVIQNGYDEEDFEGTVPADLPCFSIVHTGQLRRGPRPLWEALARTLSAHPSLRGQVHFWQVGFVDAAAAEELGTPPEGVTVHLVPPVAQREAIGYMLGADLLLVEEFGPVMPSKTLQYLRAGRPILALLDRGNVLREALGGAPQAYLLERDDGTAIGEVIARLATGPRGRPIEPGDDVAAYSRRAIAGRFAQVLDSACGQRLPRPARAPAANPVALA
jgi:hypothetical protein